MVFRAFLFLREIFTLSFSINQQVIYAFAYIGDNLDVGNDQSGYWEDTTSTSTNWVQIGQVPVRETFLFANINPGPDPSQADGVDLLMQTTLWQI